MSEADNYICKAAKTCRYGVAIHNGYGMCDYIGVTGESRFHNGPKGEIVDGKCGYYEDWSDVRTRFGAKNRIENKIKKRHVF